MSCDVTYAGFPQSLYRQKDGSNQVNASKWANITKYFNLKPFLRDLGFLLQDNFLFKGSNQHYHCKNEYD